MPDLPINTELNAHLRVALRDANPYIRAGAALALGRLKDQDALEPLLEALADPVHIVHQQAARGLSLLGVPAVGAMLALLQDPLSRIPPDRVAETLGSVRDPAAVDILSAALNYLDPPARLGAAEALGLIGDARATPALIQAVRAADPATRQRAAQALLRISDPNASHALTSLLGEEDARLRQLAVEGLGRIGGEQAILSILTILADPDENVRISAAAALRSARTVEHAEILLTALNSPNAWIQQTLAEVLGGLDLPPVHEALYALATREGDLQTRLTAAQSLLNLGDRRGEAMILRTLNAPNTETRRLAAIALALAGDQRAADPLMGSITPQALDPATPQGRQLRRRVAAALQSLGSQNHARLIAALGDASPAFATAAYDALLQAGGQAVPALVEALQTQPNVRIREQAAQILGRVGDPRAVKALTNVLRTALIGPYPVVYFSRLFVDVTADLRVATAAALGQMESLDGASILLSASRQDPDPDVRVAAQQALALVGAPLAAARAAEVDVQGFINRGVVSAFALLAVGFISGAVSLLWGIPDVALLAGLISGAALGVSDGLEGWKKPVRRAILGGLAAALFGWIIQGWPASAAGILFPVAGSLSHRGRVELLQRLAGLFGGMVMGFIGAGLAAVMLGTIQ